MNINNEEIYYPQSPTRFTDEEELFVANSSRNPFDVPTTSTTSVFAPTDSCDDNGMDFDESILNPPTQPQQLSACAHSYPDNINEFVVDNLDELMPIGKVFNVVEKKVIFEVIVDKNSKVHDLVSQNNVNLRENNSLDPELVRKQLKLQVGALLFTKEGKPIGKITDIFGTVTNPFYILTYPDISTMRTVFNIPETLTTTSETTTNEKKEDVPPSTPTKQTKQKSEKQLSTPKKKAENEDGCIDDFFNIPDPRDLKIVELKPYLQRRGLSPWGKKKTMIANIRKYERDKQKKKLQTTPSTTPADEKETPSSDSESSDSEEESETLFTPKKRDPTPSVNGEKFALRTLKDLEGMESDDEEQDTKKDQKKANTSTEKLSQSEIARIKEFGLVYCHNLHSAKLDETSTQHMIMNHAKAYDAILNSDEKTEVMTFSDDEDESTFKHLKKEERKNPPPVPVLKRKYEETIKTTEDEADTPSKVSKKLPFIDISEAKQLEKTTSTEISITTPQIDNNTSTPSTVKDEPKPQITPKQHTKSSKPTPKSTTSTKTSSSERKPRVRPSAKINVEEEQPSLLSKWCLIM